MYSVIKKNLDLLLKRPLLVQDITDYLYLLKYFRECDDIRGDIIFEGKYRKYWKMNAARLGAAFYTSYFKLMQENRLNHEYEIRDVVERLYHKHSAEGIQYSFASKLVHMINPCLPIYDSVVASFYFYTPPAKRVKRENEDDHQYMQRNFQERTDDLGGFYTHLRNEYKRIIEQKLLEHAILKFRNRFAQCTPDNYTDERIIDSLIWHFVDAVAKREIIYS